MLIYIGCHKSNGMASYWSLFSTRLFLNLDVAGQGHIRTKNAPPPRLSISVVKNRGLIKKICLTLKGMVKFKVTFGSGGKNPIYLYRSFFYDTFFFKLFSHPVTFLPQRIHGWVCGVGVGVCKHSSNNICIIWFMYDILLMNSQETIQLS